ncbi:hypothetical protein M5689_002262 [Euphorbia peplus]|nr:hypothetical protein M5689_002262 [Euphorbia peplus]
MDDTRVTYVGSLLSNLIKLIPVDFEHLKTFWGFEDQLNQLRESVVVIADLVEDAEQKQDTMEDARRWLRNLKEVNEQKQDTVEDARRWLRNLKEVAYEADNLLSELAYETTRLQKVSIILNS